MDTVHIEGDTVRAVSPEGQQAVISVAELLQRLAPTSLSTGELVVPDGVKCVLSRGRTTIWVHETPPRTYNFRWITANSPAPFGRGTQYRDVRISLPYLVVFAVFGADRPVPHHLGNANECFFRTKPFGSLDDELRYPALLNCSKYPIPDGRPLAWICTQHLDATRFLGEADPNKCMRLGFQELLRTLLSTGFNLSSEKHEGSSWFTESAGVDPRVATVEAWEQATRKDPFFVLDVPWLETGHTVRQVAERIFANHGARAATYRTSADVARVVYNHAPV
jgi:hypothetical protein